MKPTINLTIATDMRGMGGIATMLNIYQQTGFFEKWNIRLLSTHCDENTPFGRNSLYLYCISIIKVIFYHLFYKVGLVHIHMASRGSYLRKSLLVRLIKRLGGKVILHLHGAEFRDFYAAECNLRKQQHIRRTFEQADAVIVLSTQWLLWAKAVLKRSDHVTVIYNTVPSVQGNRTKTVPGQIAFLGRLSQRKGSFDLIEAFSKIKEACPHSRLILAGDGDIDAAQHQANALGLAEAVDCIGWVSGAKKEALLASADIYCLPSYNEGFPMGVLEAMSAGVPVVASKAGGIPDAITDQKEGLLIDAGDINSLAQSLIRLIEHRELNTTYSKAANQKFLEHFSLDAVMPQLDALYSKLLGYNS